MPGKSTPARIDPLTRTAAAHHLHHRQRLRRKFLDSEGSGVHDYELLEIMLGAIIPRKDVKPLAKDLLNRFGSLKAVFAASGDSLRAVDGLAETSAAFIKVVHEMMLRILKSNFTHRNIVATYDQLVSYCLVLLSDEVNEQVRLLTLDSNRRIIGEYLHAKGDLQETPIFTRQIFKRALHDNATGIVIVHNHPNGTAKPSQQDVIMTEHIRRTGLAVSVEVFDHLIVVKNRVISFRNLGYL